MKQLIIALTIGSLCLYCPTLAGEIPAPQRADLVGIWKQVALWMDGEAYVVKDPGIVLTINADGTGKQVMKEADLEEEFTWMLDGYNWILEDKETRVPGYSTIYVDEDVLVWTSFSTDPSFVYVFKRSR